jgi:hypothetical protein
VSAAVLARKVRRGCMAGVGEGEDAKAKVVVAEHYVGAVLILRATRYG